MRSHAKTSTAGSTWQRALSRERLATAVSALVATAAAMALLAAPASAAAPTIKAAWAEGVVLSEATLQAEINPEGSATTYHFEYGTSAAYGSETPELAVGSDSAVHKVVRYLEGLQPGTAYHYRVVATSAGGIDEGPDLMFTTYEPLKLDTDCPNQIFRDGPSAKLPDCRAYEMVSPIDKSGLDALPTVEAVGNDLNSDQAAADGDKMAYGVGFSFGDAVTNLYAGTEFIASRSAAGWSSHAITPARENNREAGVSLNEVPGVFSAFTEDLSTGFYFDDSKPPLTPDAAIGTNNFYLRDNATETYTALTTQLLSGQFTLGGMGFQGYSKDGSHAIFTARAQLTPDAQPGTTNWQLYDYHDGELELVSILPGGAPAAESSAGQAGHMSVNAEAGETHNAISEDGSRIFWMTEFLSGFSEKGKLYARIDGETTIPVSGSVSAEPNATYWTASADGSTVVFNSGKSLYRFDVDTETPSLIANEVDPGNGVLGASEDASSVYFLSREVLAAGATAGEPNLYLDREGTKVFIATLASQDETDISSTATNGSGPADSIVSDFSQVTPDGGHVVFHSRASLTGYDNTSLDTGGPAIEIYAYDADADQLICISCNPSGGRPETGLLPNPHHSYGVFTLNAEAAAWLPTPRRGTYIPRMVANDGSHVFFNSLDALALQDTNGAQDVYEWVEQGVGGCKQASGCVSLISTGTDSEKSTFIDASEGGRDAFFRTGDDIDPDDPALIDIYDARIGGGFAHQASPPPCVGDACQSAPSAPNDPTPASASFKGAGDPTPAKPRRRCRARKRQAKAGSAKHKRKAAKRCKRANRGAGR